MHSAVRASGLSLLAIALVGLAPPVRAQGNRYFAGYAVGGQAVTVDLATIRAVSTEAVDFVYYLGRERVVAQAYCAQGYWVSFPERQRNYPQSKATRNMLTTVCRQRSLADERGVAGSGVSRTAVGLVFDPPSNVRTSPNGPVLCSVRSRRSINLLGRQGDWYITDVCGERGYIHQGQIRF
jgi:hypothetical protein